MGTDQRERLCEELICNSLGLIWVYLRNLPFIISIATVN
jgi:hypothetical protein